jgi:translation initiation factor 3 subunit I
LIPEIRSVEPDEPLLVFNPVGSKAQVVAFSALDKHLVTGHENGKVALWDVKTGEEVASREKNHNGLITDLQMSADRTYFLTSSKDKSARVSLQFHPSLFFFSRPR